MQVGSLTLRQDGSGAAGFGELTTLDLAFNFNVFDYTGPGGDQAPVFTVMAKAAHGRQVEIGRVWKKTMVRGEKAGQDFYNFTFDDPSFARPVYAAAFPVEDRPDYYQLVWNRPRRADRPAGADPAAAADGQGQDQAGAEIPF